MLSPLSFTVYVLLGIVAVIAQSSDDVPTISAVGAKFFFANGTQYYIKGIHSPRLMMSEIR